MRFIAKEGASVAQSLLGEDLVDYLFRYQSPKLFSGSDALPGPDLDTLNPAGGRSL
jgi:riboflavin biosynthesis pyrimidine reductase